jgi:hypothetical protein
MREITEMKLKPALNRLLTIGIGLALTIFGVNIVRHWLPEAEAITEARYSPYTVALRETAREPSGKTASVHLYQIALTSNGTYVLRVERLDQEETRIVRNVHLPGGLEIKMNDRAARKSTRRTRSQIFRSPAGHCTFETAGEKLQGIENVAGYRAAKVTRPNVTEPRRTSWYSLDHGCALVGERFEWADGAVSEKILVSLVAGEPQDSLSVVPAHYTETAPSGLVPGGESHSPAVHTAHDKWDEDYYNHRP